MTSLLANSLFLKSYNPMGIDIKGWLGIDVKEWQAYISQAQKELKKPRDAKVLGNILEKGEYLWAPENMKATISEIRARIAEKLMEGDDLDIRTLLAIVKTEDPKVTEIAVRKLLKSDLHCDSLIRAFRLGPISDELRKEIFAKIQERPKEMGANHFGFLLRDRKLSIFWDDIEKLLFSPDVTSETLYYVSKFLYSPDCDFDHVKEIQEKIEKELVKRGLALYAKYDHEDRRFMPVFRDASGEEFEIEFPLKEKWIEGKIKDQPLSSKEDLFKEILPLHAFL